MSAEYAVRLWAPLLVLLLSAGVVTAALDDTTQLEHSPTSYGAVPQAWGASFDVLEALGHEPSRSRARFDRRSTDRPQWLVRPTWGELELAQRKSEIEQYARRGGTAVVMDATPTVWKGLGFAVDDPEAANTDGSGADEPRPSDSDAGQKKGGANKRNPATAPRIASGGWLPSHRALAAQAFTLPLGEGVEVRVKLGELPFVLERRLGPGRVVAIADPQWLTNDQLDAADHALFLLDLVGAYGKPVFDERCHGLLETRSPWQALGNAWVVLVLLASTLFGAVLIGHARRWPSRARADDEPDPTLELFVSSLASLYEARGRHEPTAVFAAYRAGFLNRLRRKLFGHLAVSEQRVEARLLSEAAQAGAQGKWLAGESPLSALELQQAVRVLERYAAQLQGKKGRP